MRLIFDQVTRTSSIETFVDIIESVAFQLKGLVTVDTNIVDLSTRRAAAWENRQTHKVLHKNHGQKY